MLDILYTIQLFSINPLLKLKKISILINTYTVLLTVLSFFQLLAGQERYRAITSA